MKVYELIALLKTVPQNAEVAVNPTVGVTNWLQEPLPFLGETDKGEIVVGLMDTTIHSEESNISWFKAKLTNSLLTDVFNAPPGKCPHQGDKTAVQGGGWSCNSCGEYC